jgi:hypothetical protein
MTDNKMKRKGKLKFFMVIVKSMVGGMFEPVKKRIRRRV